MLIFSRVLYFVVAIGLAVPALVSAQDDSLASPASKPRPTFAFYYASNPPIPELRSFDNVVVDPDSGFSPSKVNTPSTKWLAYVSLGEIEAGRSYAKAVPESWIAGNNSIWAGKVVDQTAAGWKAFVLDQIIEPLWAQGYRGFFLDTLDSYQLVAKTDAARQAQQDGLVAVIAAIKQRHPDAELIFNRGFELMPRIGQFASAVAFESLTQGWDERTKQYSAVLPAERQWLLNQVNTIGQRWHVPVISIDYCRPGDKVCASTAVKTAQSAGLIPYVADGRLGTVGQGDIQVVPRRVIILQQLDSETNIDNSDGVRFIATPINYLGYKIEYVDVKDDLPEDVFGDRYAGVVIWANGQFPEDGGKVEKWLEARKKAGVPLLFLNQLGASTDSRLAQALALRPVSGLPSAALQVEHKDPIIGFELMPKVDLRTLAPLQAGPGSQVLMRLRAGSYAVDQVAITPWGGFALAPFPVVTIDNVEQTRWALEPIELLKRALRLTPIPVPDVTTEYGRRMLMAHVDGDGFASRNEFFPGGYPGESLTREIWNRYRVPTTLSVIEGEVGPTGMYPKLSPMLEDLARKMFALPYVEIGTHTYSHPFNWDETLAYINKKPGQSSGEANEDFILKIPGYKFNLDREISGSIHYINERLTTPKKPVVMLQWPGSCDPPAIAVEKTYAAGVLNFNGGDTIITRSNNSWTAIAPLGINKGPGAYQIFAPNQNENIYTNSWLGPFYGFQRVNETFDMTDKPIRFKPMDIYYHMYSGTKLASIEALKKVYEHALSQPNFPLFPTEYARKVLDFETMSLARRGDTWLVRTDGQLHTMRLAPGMAPALTQAVNVAGYQPGPNGVYVSLVDRDAAFAMVPANDPAVGNGPYLATANGKITQLVRNATGLSFAMTPHMAPIVQLGDANACRISVDGRAARTRVNGHVTEIDFGSASAPERTFQVEVKCAG